MSDELHRSSDDAPEVIVAVDERVYELEAVFRAAYKFIDLYYVSFEKADVHGVTVRLQPKPGVAMDKCQLAGEFQNELLHCALRRSVLNETKQVREMILGRALFGALIDLDEHGPEAIAETAEALEHPRTPGGSYAGDEAGIAKDWFA